MNKKIIILAVVAIAALGGIMFATQRQKKLTVYDLPEVEVTELEEFINQQEGEYIVYYFLEGCPDCQEFNDDIFGVYDEENDLPIYVLIMTGDQWADKEEDGFRDWLVETVNVEYAPTLVKYDGNTEIDRINWDPENGIFTVEEFIDLVR